MSETDVMKPPVILAVEDEALIQELIIDTLEEAGFEVLPVQDAEQAIAALERENFRVLITDVDLGRGKTGWDIAHRARELHPQIGVIYVTGGGVSEWPAHGVPNSIVVPKPFAPPQLVTAVSQLLNSGGVAAIS